MHLYALQAIDTLEKTQPPVQDEAHTSWQVRAACTWCHHMLAWHVGGHSLFTALSIADGINARSMWVPSHTGAHHLCTDLTGTVTGGAREACRGCVP
jgi:hypothetical protein